MRKPNKRVCAVVVDGVLSALCVILFFSTWPLFEKILTGSSVALTVALAVLACLPLLTFAIVPVFGRSKRFPAICLAHVLFAVAVLAEHIVFLAYMMSKLYYLLIEGAPYLIVAAEAAILLVLVFLNRFKKKAARWVVVAALGISFVFADIAYAFDLRIMYLNADAVVFAVGDEYQIAFGSSARSIGSVTIGDRTFYDARGGANNVSTVHKVVVPCEVLDKEKSYIVSCTAMIRSRAYLSTSGKTVKKTFRFRPTDEADGLRIFSFSDNHMLKSGVVKASRYFGDSLDLVIANGDLLNDVSDEYQITLMYRTLAAISSSSVPVIMSRGNHESVGSMLSSLPDFIGSENGNIFFTARFNDTLFVVLDVANDVSDEDFTIRPVANFDEYRAEELEWLRTLKSAAELKEEGVKHVIAVCHIPYPLYISKIHTEFISALIDETERMGVELLIGGHRHMTYLSQAGAEDDPANYPYLVGGKRSDSLEVDETVFASQYTGTAIVIQGDEIYAKFVNSKGKVLQEFEI